MEWKNIYRGMLMGASDLIPGVSGGTIAVVLGIYDRFIEAINGFFTKQWSKSLKFLIPLGTGIIASLLLLSSLIHWLFEHYPHQLQFFFLGLIAGILPFLFREAGVKEHFSGFHYILLLAAAMLVASMVFFKEPGVPDILDTSSTRTWILLFFSGWVASMAMMLPGISGSFILLLIGVYPTVMAALKDRNLFLIGIVGAGVIVGIVISSKIIQYFLVYHRSSTYAVIIGLVVGSLAVVYPGMTDGMGAMFLSLLSLLLGLAAAVSLGKLEYKR
ncbi:putative membrane protein [Melghiribacillus thermohalophilus]|uniref:Putative membrane protein n=1 Tax=Melghiribacillus thermohalophilus TaxID=1324956 RepID=A0A4R3N163_9BACI|nr:DUF368 domain-containing protein [Melghiribacillus thermohalophilus]TCT20359.1 putative membrane protein [Melghiribacillus thermohalophilus]